MALPQLVESLSVYLSVSIPSLVPGPGLVLTCGPGHVCLVLLVGALPFLQSFPANMSLLIYSLHKDLLRNRYVPGPGAGAGTRVSSVHQPTPGPVGSHSATEMTFHTGFWDSFSSQKPWDSNEHNSSLPKGPGLQTKGPENRCLP